MEDEIPIKNHFFEINLTKNYKNYNKVNKILSFFRFQPFGKKYECNAIQCPIYA